MQFTDVPACSDTSYSDTSLKMTLMAIPKPTNRNNLVIVTNDYQDFHPVIP